MPRKARSAKKVGDVSARRDVILGDQYNLADLSAVESLLREIAQLLRESQSAVRVKPGAEGEPLVTVEGTRKEVRLPGAHVDQLAEAEVQGLPGEDVYLTRLILNASRTRWDRGELGKPSPQDAPPLRLNDPDDEAIAEAGLSLDDVREAITKHGKTRLVVLGDPGAGKTIVLHRLAFELARERLRSPETRRLPFYVSLAAFTGEARPGIFLERAWKRSGLEGTYDDAVAQGQVCFLLDGLDRMPAANRERLSAAWARWARDELPDGNWAVFTCRTADYLPALDLPQVIVQDLESDQVRRYFELRFPSRDVAAHWRRFEKHLRETGGRLDQLARNPLFLSLLTRRLAEGQAPIDSWAKLLDDLVSGLLEHELSQERQPENLRADSRGSLQAGLNALGRLAFTMQSRGQTALPASAARKVALAEKGELRLMLDEVVSLATGARLLEESGRAGAELSYVFSTRLWQEYFAARELLRRFRAGQSVAQCWRLPWKEWKAYLRPGRVGQPIPPLPRTGWDEPVILAVGLAGRDAPALIEAVRKDNLPLAARAVAAAGERAPLKKVVHALRPRLVARQRKPVAYLPPALDLAMRLEAGLALGEIGHPDLLTEEVKWDGKPVRVIVPPLETVPAGVFLHGSALTDSQSPADTRTAQREINLPAFAIGRYPVTNAEFRCFIDAGGYRDERCWSPAGWRWQRQPGTAHAALIEDWMRIWEELQDRNLRRRAQALNWRPAALEYWTGVQRMTATEARKHARQLFNRSLDRPAYWDSAEYNSPLKPVVGVNWFEAEAYCTWLSAVTGRAFRLPSEVEWEKAARGANGHRYPWGEPFDTTRCNTSESRLYTPTPVGMFPRGVSPYGLFDVAGTVWEWTADWYQAYPGGEVDESAGPGSRHRAFRGGSWYATRQQANCISRDKYRPVNYDTDLGFRVLAPAGGA